MSLHSLSARAVLAMAALCAFAPPMNAAEPPRRTLITRHQTELVDIDTSEGAAYGDTLSWPPAAGPGLGERPVDVVLDIDLPRFERLVVKLLRDPK